MLVVFAERSKQGRSLLVFILALGLSVGLLVTLCDVQLVWLSPLCYWPGRAS